jgi:hypothetical protein
MFEYEGGSGSCSGRKAKVKFKSARWFRVFGVWQGKARQGKVKGRQGQARPGR